MFDNDVGAILDEYVASTNASFHVCGDRSIQSKKAAFYPNILSLWQQKEN